MWTFDPKSKQLIKGAAISCSPEIFAAAAISKTSAYVLYYSSDATEYLDTLDLTTGSCTHPIKIAATELEKLAYLRAKDDKTLYAFHFPRGSSARVEFGTVDPASAAFDSSRELYSWEAPWSVAGSTVGRYWARYPEGLKELDIRHGEIQQEIPTSLNDTNGALAVWGRTPFLMGHTIVEVDPNSRSYVPVADFPNDVTDILTATAPICDP